jgi:hypothetical protein
MTNRDQILKVISFMKKYPEAKVICMVNEDACPYNYSSQLAGIGSVTHDYYLMTDDYGLEEDRIYFKSNKEVEYVVEDWYCDNKIGSPDYTSIIKALDAQWVECIVIEITSP